MFLCLSIAYVPSTLLKRLCYHPVQQPICADPTHTVPRMSRIAMTSVTCFASTRAKNAFIHNRVEAACTSAHSESQGYASIPRPSCQLAHRPHPHRQGCPRCSSRRYRRSRYLHRRLALWWRTLRRTLLYISIAKSKAQADADSPLTLAS